MQDQSYYRFCPECGHENTYNARYCTQCGTDLLMAEDAVPEADVAAEATSCEELAVERTQPFSDPVASQDALVDADAGATFSREPVKTKAPKWRAPVIVAVCAAVALVVGGLAYGVYAWQQAQAAEQAYQQAHQLHDVPMTIVAPNYTEGATRIPLHVTGTDLDGNAVDQPAYVGADGTGLQLMQGDYQLSVVASPILEDGSLYVVPDTVVEVAVHDDPTAADGGSAAAGSQGAAVVTDKVIEFVAADPASVTDDMIAAAKAAAEADDQGADKADQLAQLATQRRDDAVTQVTEEQRRQEGLKKTAVAYAEAFNTTSVVTNEVEGPAGAQFYVTADVEDYPLNCLQYVEKGSKLWDALNVDAYAVLTGSSDEKAIFWCGAATWDASAEVVDVDGNVVTVRVTFYAGQMYPSTDYKQSQKPWIDEMTLYFGDDGLIYDQSVSTVQEGA